ncbi:MAG: anti-sigma factor [Marinomonas sp.]
MSPSKNKEPTIKRDDPMLAAEYSLGLLEGEELLEARGKMTSGGIFVSRKDWWDNWFIPLSDEMDGAAPDAQVWERINAAVNAKESGADAGADVVSLKTRLRNWQIAGSTAAAAAVAAVALMVVSPGQDPAGSAPVIAAQQAPLMANVPIGDTNLRIGVTYLPEAKEMLVSASGLTADGVHDHELWLVPADGSELQSLGVVVAGEERRVTLPAEITGNMGDGVAVVLTREPLGGKPDGVDAGPVVAEGAFTQV